MYEEMGELCVLTLRIATFPSFFYRLPSILFLARWNLFRTLGTAGGFRLQ